MPIAQMEQEFPEAFEGILKRFTRLLKGHYRDMQDMGIYCENKALYLQTRNEVKQAQVSL